MNFLDIFIARGQIVNAKRKLLKHNRFDTSKYKMARGKLLALVFEYKEILSDKEYLSLMNTK